MKQKTAYLIINPRLGKNLDKLTDMLAVFSAASWKTDTALKEFGGHTMQLAKKAADAGYDLVIGYGGDGTLNQVVNGVMASKHRRSIVGVIPGGTANVWAHEIGLPEDPVKAALLLINSAAREVDLGHVEVDTHPSPRGPKARTSKERFASGGRHHFLLMAGLGVDAAVLRGVSTSLKDKIGETAVALAAVKALPSQHAFPIEIRSLGAGKKRAVRWKGEALQVIVGNTRRYGNIAEVTPDAYIDDGVLDVCVITAGDPLTTVQQIVSILLHRDQVHGRSKYIQGVHVEITVPASVKLQLDGSAVKRKDCLAMPDKTARQEPQDTEPETVTYRFDSMPHALRLAIPCTYGGDLFEAASENDDAPATEPQRADQDDRVAEPAASEDAHKRTAGADELLAHGRKVTVIAAGPNPERKSTYIVAGGTSEKRTGESRPVAVRIDHDTTLMRASGEPLPAAFAADLPEGNVIVVEGKRNKRGVIRAKRAVVVT